MTSFRVVESFRFPFVYRCTYEEPFRVHHGCKDYYLAVAALLLAASVT